MSSLTDLTLREMREGLDAGTFSSTELTRAHLDRIDSAEADIHAFLHVSVEVALAAAGRFDARRQARDGHRTVAGIPLAIKDLFCTHDMPTTCGSRLLEEYVPPYDATLVDRLRQAGAVLVGKTNMDEFAMGSSCENSAYGPTCNPRDPSRVPGGSSGGSAAAVAAGEVPGSFGTDTGGSIRQPAAFCGIVGLKPTYGRVSRYGLVSFASSLDQAGPMARCVDDVALLLEAVWGHDPRDTTSSRRQAGALAPEAALKGLTFGLPREYLGPGLEPGVRRAVESAAARLAGAGAEMREISLPHTDVAVPTYYLVATAEASANLARYDGVRYGRRQGDADGGLVGIYEATRSAGFGAEVKRRIMLGTYALSTGYYDAWYLQAQKVRTLIREDFSRAFAAVDVILSPTTPGVAFPLGERLDDPLAMYLSDVFTVPSSLAGLPALSLPCGTANGLPVGLQLIGNLFDENRLLQAARGTEAALGPAPGSRLASGGGRE